MRPNAVIAPLTYLNRALRHRFGCVPRVVVSVGANGHPCCDFLGGESLLRPCSKAATEISMALRRSAAPSELAPRRTEGALNQLASPSGEISPTIALLGPGPQPPLGHLWGSNSAISRTIGIWHPCCVSGARERAGRPRQPAGEGRWGATCDERRVIASVGSRSSEVDPVLGAGLPVVRGRAPGDKPRGAEEEVP